QPPGSLFFADIRREYVPVDHPCARLLRSGARLRRRSREGARDREVRLLRCRVHDRLALLTRTLTGDRRRIDPCTPQRRQYRDRYAGRTRCIPAAGTALSRGVPRVHAPRRRRARAPMRHDLQLIADLVKPGARVLDLGCGDGELLAHLQREKHVNGYGLEIDAVKISACIERGVNVVEQDLDRGLESFATGSFDLVVMTETLRAGA